MRWRSVLARLARRSAGQVNNSFLRDHVIHLHFVSLFWCVLVIKTFIILHRSVLHFSILFLPFSLYIFLGRIITKQNSKAKYKLYLKLTKNGQIFSRPTNSIIRFLCDLQFSVYFLSRFPCFSEFGVN